MLGTLLTLPACAEGVFLLAWLGSSLLTAGALLAGRRLVALDWTRERQRVLTETAQQLGIPAPAPNQELVWTSPAGLEVRAHATPQLELRMSLPVWVPNDLVVDTIAPPMRGLRQLVPDPRFLEWVAAGDNADLLGVMLPPVRNALLEAHHYGPGPGICIRRGGLEVALPWRDLDMLATTVERMERIHLCLDAQPRALSERLLASVDSDDRFDIRQASLRAMLDRFPHHPATKKAQQIGERDHLLPKALPGPRQDAQRGRLALVRRDDGALSFDDDEAA